jgi:hypothetical protein
MNFFFSKDLNALLAQIGQYGIGLGTSVGSFGDPSKLHFHNLIGSPSIKLQTLFMGETLYYMIGQPNESTKNLNKCISMCPTKVSRTSFKQPKTQVLKFGISWINFGMKGQSCETMKAFIKFAKI